MIAKTKIYLAAVTLLALLLIGILGTGMAAADSGGGSVGGGLWYWSNIPHTFAKSEYWHDDKLHSATAKVGGNTTRKTAYAGVWAIANQYGWGLTQVFWNTY